MDCVAILDTSAQSCTLQLTPCSLFAFAVLPTSNYVAAFVAPLGEFRRFTTMAHRHEAESKSRPCCVRDADLRTNTFICRRALCEVLCDMIPARLR
ncbi:hypothetical protein Y032_0233g3100 [Ancylostoma ceylanicum]|uniref:Uncharacterized protein n=1 Tax=Ancylostoma ceylanicum TaxID=53326 RepID=A0A016SG04_9BILA|nr:hypothetical protein Y032_0233g3100 [Ancylostoma ceylanicum]